MIRRKLKNLVNSFFMRIIDTLQIHDCRLKYHENAIDELKQSIMLLNAHFLHFDEALDQKLILRSHEFKRYSQNGEDGILLYIFSKIGVKNQKFVEFGIEDGRECNTANLSLNWGWSGLLIEGSPTYYEKAKNYYRNNPKVTILCSYVTPQNINKLLVERAILGEIDLLSIDIDGNDFWVWESIHDCSPRVVIIEYNAYLGHDKSIVVKFDPVFDRFKKHPSGYYHGASLLALQKLAQRKGYILIGCDSRGCNAFFLRSDLAHYGFEEQSAATSYYPLTSGLPIRPTPEEAFQLIKNLEFVQI